MDGLGENVLCYVELGWIVRFASFELVWTGLDTPGLRYNGLGCAERDNAGLV